MKWIRVSERLPDKRTGVLMYANGILYAGDYYSKGEWWSEDTEGGYIVEDVTHWMLAPDPPE